MADGLLQIETKELRLCLSCQFEAWERDRFCRRCGQRLEATNDWPQRGAAQPTVDAYHRVSGPLVAAVAQGISTNTAQLHNRSARGLMLALLSVPIWLIIVLLSPLDAYVTTKAIAKQV